MFRTTINLLRAILLLRRRQRTMAELAGWGMLADYQMAARGGAIHETALVRLPGGTTLRMTGAGAAGLARIERRTRR